MNRPKREPAWRPSPVTLVAGALVIAGFALTGVSWWFLLLSAVGTLGPGLLREVGWLRDRDEFQRLAEYRAGYHAYAVSVLLAFVLVTWFRATERQIESPQELATLFLTVLWFSWFLSSVIAYWGSQKAAFRVLCAFGGGWLLFALASNVGAEWTGWAAFLLHPLLAAPFFGLAWLSVRRPRLAGVLLLAAAAFFVHFFGFFQRDNFAMVTQAVTFVLFVGPLVACGIALLTAGREQDDEASED